jgi:hypothetical protein
MGRMYDESRVGCSYCTVQNKRAELQHTKMEVGFGMVHIFRLHSGRKRQSPIMPSMLPEEIIMSTLYSR